MSRSYIVFSLGACVDIKDHLGRNFLHFTVQQPYGLKNLQPEFMQVIDMYVDLHKPSWIQVIDIYIDFHKWSWVK